MRKLLIAGILLACSCPVWAQQINVLKIGDKVPDITIGPVQNYPKQQIRFSELRGKLVLLDFWHGACFSCIKAFPKLEALQKKFGDRLQVIMVNFEPRDKIEQTFDRWKHIHTYRFPNAPSIIGDTLLHKLFPHKYVPHEVWIDQNGVVCANTSVEEVTDENIQSMLDGRQAKMEMKVDNITFKGDSKPTLTQVYSQNPGCLKYYSAILNYLPGIMEGVSRRDIDSAQNTIRVTRRNMNIPQLFSYALAGGMGVDPFESPRFDFGKRVILQVRDSSKYLYLPGTGLTPGEWRAKNCFTYESVMPLSQQENEMFTSMHHELERFFNVSCHLEKRKMKCLALVRLPGAKNDFQNISLTYPTKNEKSGIPDTAFFRMKNHPARYLLDEIARANRFTPYVFSAQMALNEGVTLELKKSLLKDLPQLRKELRRYNLDLVELEQEVEVFVLAEK